MPFASAWVHFFRFLCCVFFSFVCLPPMFCVPNVASFSGLFLFCLSSSCVLCTQCCQFLWIVFVLFVFLLCLVYPMLPVSLECFCFVCLLPMSCVPNVASFSGLSIFGCPPWVFFNVYLLSNLCTTLFY